MEELSRRLIEALRDPRTICVFPTETVARSWLERIVSMEGTPFPVMREDRFISWDTCRSRLFPRKDERTPSNSVYRLVFAVNILLDNAAVPFLSFLVPPSCSEDSQHFARDITALCPHLQTLQGCMETLDPAFQHDISLLLQRYHAFLAEHDLFEPLYEPEILDEEYLRSADRRFVLVFPEIMTEMYRVGEQLSESGRITMISVHDENPGLPLMGFENSRVEVVNTVGRIEALLAEGIPAEDIVVTLCDYEGMAQDLAAEARLRGLPIHFRSGKRLSDYPVSRLFRDISYVVQDSFSLVSMKRLLLEQGYAWRDRELNGQLVAAGIEGSCIRNYTGPSGRPVDVWEQKLPRQGGQLSRYLSLRDWITSITSAVDPAELLARLRGFQKEFLDPFSPEDERGAVLSYCIGTLQDFADATERIDLPKGFPVYASWLTLMENTRYVQQGSSGGISVYPYGAAAGIAPEYHFILGLDQNHAVVTVDPFSMLPERDRESLGPVQVDLTEDFLTVYQRSGRFAALSYSRRTRDGDQLAPHYFMASSMIESFSGPAYGNDPYTRELELWAGDGEPSPFHRFYPVQANGFRRAEKTVFARSWRDLTNRAGSVEPQYETLRRVFHTEGGRVSVSPTSLDKFVKCPFSWYLHYGLKIQDVDYEAAYTDPMAVGNLIHSCCEQFFRWLSEERDGLLTEGSLDEAEERLHGIIEEVISAYMKTREAVSPAVVPEIARLLHEKLPSLLQWELETLPGFSLHQLETRLSYTPDEGDYTLEGQEDRVSRRLPGRETAIIDYKKNCRVKPNSFAEGAGPPNSYQLPFYTYLAEQEDPGTTEVVNALYYDVTKEKYVSILPYAWRDVLIDRERFEQVIDQMLEEIGVMVDRIGSADYRIDSIPPKHCQQCRFRDICRGRFSIR